LKTRILAVTVAVAVAASITAATSTPAAAALDTGDILYDISCDGLGYVDFSVDVNGDPGDSFDITVNGGPYSDTPYAPGMYELSLDGVEDGVYYIEVTDHATGDWLTSVEFGVSCNGPVFSVGAECLHGEGLDGRYGVGYAIYDNDEWTYDVYLDGVLIGDDITGDIEGAGYESGAHYPAGTGVSFELYWNDESTSEPWYQTILGAACDEDNDSGTGIPDTGSNTMPLLILASGLLLGGFALLGIRRTRNA